MNEVNASIFSLPPLLAVPQEPQPETCSICGGQSFVIRVLRGSTRKTTTWACGTCHPETVASGGTVYHYGNVQAIREAIATVLPAHESTISEETVPYKLLGFCEICQWGQAYCIWAGSKRYCDACKAKELNKR